MRIRIALLIALLLITFPVAANASAANCATNGAYLTVGDRLSANDSAALFDSLSCVVRADYANAGAHEDRLQAALQLGHYGTAASDASALRELDQARFETLLNEAAVSADASHDTYALSLLGLLQWADARDAQALSTFEAILSQQPAHVFATLFRGSSRLYSGDDITSIADFQQAVNLDPGNADVYSIIGSTHQQVGNVFDALMALDRAIALNPRDARSHYFRGMALLDNQDLTGARDEFTAAVSHDPSYLDAWYDRARVNYLLTNQTGAIDDLNHALEINPDYDLALVFRGALYEWSGQRELAASDFFAYTRAAAPAILSSGSLSVNMPATVNLNTGLLYSFTFEGSAGDLVQLTAAAAQAQADPLIIVLGPDGQTPVAGSDDAAPTVPDALIAGLTLPQSGIYTVLVTQSDSAQTGQVVVTLSNP